VLVEHGFVTDGQTDTGPHSFSHSRDIKARKPKRTDRHWGNVCIGLGTIWGDLGHSWSSATPPFDRVHTTSYSAFVETRLGSTLEQGAIIVHAQTFLHIAAKMSVFCGIQNTPKCVSGPGSTPDPTGGDHDAPPDL